MKRIIIIVVSVCLSIMSCRQGQNQPKSTLDKFNLDFEQVENGMPVGWDTKGGYDYIFSSDSIIVKSGKYSASIEMYEGTPQFGVLGLIIHNNYEGKRVTLSGYVKSENVDGYASLLMRIDPEIGVKEVKIKGTTDWKKYEVSLKMNPRETKAFAVGAILVGKGKVWFDDVRICIDGKDINELESVEIEEYHYCRFNCERNYYHNRNDFYTKLSSYGRIEEQSGTAHGDYLEFANSSNVVIERLDSTQIENLTNLGLIWGFLKYYHPNIAKGNYNWDYELFKIFPEILRAENNIHRDSIFIEWINGLGKFAENKKEISIKKEIKLAPDLEWIESSGFSHELTALLLKVKNSKRHRKHHYVGYYFTGNPKFKNEEPYSNMLYPDAGFRLLALYRYWNIIQYFFPYKNLIECDWKEVLREFVPKIVNTNNETEYALAILELTERIHDSHAITLIHNYSLANHFGKFSASVELTFIENQPVVTGFYNENLGRDTGMEIGDVLTKINHVPVAEIIDGLLKYTPASNYPGKLRNLAKNILRTNDSIIHVEFIRDNKPQNKVLRVFSDDKHDLHHVYSKEKDTCLEFIDDGIAYIDYSVLENKHIPKIWKKIKNTKCLIIDIRNGTSGDFPVLLFCQFLLPTKTPFFLKSTTKHYSIPGLFTIEKGYNVGRKNKNYYKGKIIILVNENTQSTGEFQTMAYRVHPNAVVVGSATAGADGNVSKFYLPGGIETWISGIGVYYPDGSETQRIGIVPDVEVKPTIQGIRESRDEVLEKAIELVNR